MKDHNKKYYQENKDDIGLRQKEYYEKHTENYRNNLLKNRFSITIDEYEKILKRQNGLCAICLQKETRLTRGSKNFKRLCVDHDHIAGKIRGLLCHDCNLAVGNFKDNPDICIRASQYLIQHTSKDLSDKDFINGIEQLRLDFGDKK